jgi:hypothetical protein
MLDYNAWGRQSYKLHFELSYLYELYGLVAGEQGQRLDVRARSATML